MSTLDDPPAGARDRNGPENLLAERGLVDLIPGPAWLCDATGRVLHCNPEAEALWARPCGPDSVAWRLCGSAALFRTDGAALAPADHPVARALAQGSDVRGAALVMQRTDGRCLTARVSVRVLAGRDGTCLGALACAQDVSSAGSGDTPGTDLEDFFENGAVGLHIVGSDGVIVRANQAELSMLGYRPEEYIGRRISDFHVDEAAVREIHAKLTRGEQLDRYPARLRARDGSIRQVLITSNARFREGRLVSTRCFTTDVTGLHQAERALRESERHLRSVLEALPAAVYTTDTQGRITFYNRAAVEVAGRVPVEGDEWCVSWRLYQPDGTPIPRDRCPMAIALREDRAIRGVEVVAERPDGSRIPLLPHPTPLHDAEGRLTGAINMLVDLSDRQRADGGARQLAAIVESSDDAILSVSIDGTILSWNEGAERLFGYTPDEVVGKGIGVLLPAERQDEEPRILERIRAGERIEHYESVRRRRDGRLLPVSLTVSPVKDARGRVIGASKIARDITERRRHEERRQLLVNELNHRVKNTLATVQSLAAQSLRGDPAAPFYREFEGRLIALSRAHDALTREDWRDVDLRELVQGAVAPLCVDPDARFLIEGPPVRLQPRLALSLAMAIHELCTNAAKYGALSASTGRIEVQWDAATTDDARHLRLRWREHGGPQVRAPGTRGFGTRLLEHALPREFGAQVELAFALEGLRWDLAVALDAAAA